ncbi:MAG TPA: RNA polymerase sigma factor [Verrucomicrobiae bacterium]|nr:RNA polymerase sigma factor [Verrucomicrobiae bacterium]
MDAPTANHLAEAARRGDKAAATRLIELFYERIYAFLRRLTGNDADAADLTQRTFSRVWQALPTFAGRSTFSSWIHGIAHHVYVDWRRANRHEPRSEEWWNARVATQPAPDETAVHNDLAAALFASVDTLDHDLREAVHLHYYQDLSLQETAEALGVATSTVKYRLRHALAQLQWQFDHDRQTLKSPYPAKAT